MSPEQLPHPAEPARLGLGRDEDVAATLQAVRVQADQVVGATNKAREDAAYQTLSDEERAAIDRSINELMVVYHGDDHLLIRAKIEQLDYATQSLAEAIMNGAIGKALEGTHIDAQ